MEWIKDNWTMIVVAVSLAVIAAKYIIEFRSQTTEKQAEKVKEWLLFAVIESEKALGGGTGKIKLRQVYDLFLQRFPTIAPAVSFEIFAGWVDDALLTMRDLLQQNKAVKEYVESP